MWLIETHIMIMEGKKVQIRHNRLIRLRRVLQWLEVWILSVQGSCSLQVSTRSRTVRCLYNYNQFLPICHSSQDHTDL